MSIASLIRTYVGKRGCGAKPEPAGRHLADFERMSLARAKATRISLEGSVPPDAPLDQGGTNACVAHFRALSEVISLRARYNVASVLPSRRAIYYWSRYAEGGPISDNGSIPSVMMNACATNGIPPESSFPWSIARINQRPPMSARWDAKDHRGLRASYQVYYTRLSDRIDAVRAALASGRCFGLCISATPEYEAASSDSTPIPWSDVSRGLHMVTCVDCDTDGSVLSIGSWGPGHGRNGRVWLSPEYLAQATSVIVVDPQEPVK